MKIYTTGGAIRDLLLGRTPKDTDFAFNGTIEDFIRLNPTARIIDLAGQSICILDGQEYTPIKNGVIEEDLHRRDFTINALLLDDSGFLHAHPHTFTDLCQKLLRPCSADSLLTVPIRALRAARFVAELPDFRPVEECNAQLLKCARENKLHLIKAELVCKELRKALASAKPGNFLRLLSDTCCLDPWFAELVTADSITAGPPPYHNGSVLEHIAEVMDAIPELAKRILPKEMQSTRTLELATWMALCHDLGKVCTPPEILPHHYQHEERGENMAANLGKRLKMPELFIKGGTLAARWHMLAGNYFKLRPGTKIKLITTIPDNLLVPFLLMACADSNLPELFKAVMDDNAIINSVHLPEEWQNQGKKSGERLFGMQCQILGKQPAYKV